MERAFLPLLFSFSFSFFFFSPTHPSHFRRFGVSAFCLWENNSPALRNCLDLFGIRLDCI